MSETRPLKLYMSCPDWNEPGGPTSHLPILIAEMKRRPDIALRTFTYGFRRWGILPRRIWATLPGRLWILVADVIVFLWMCLRHGRPDILHLNSAYEKLALGRDIPYLLICRVLGCGCVIKTHGSDEAMMGQMPSFWEWVRRLHFRLAQVITFLSPVEAQQFRDAFPDHAHKFHVAKNIVIPIEEVSASTAPGKMLFGGRFVDKKNIPNLLRGLALVADEFPEAHLVMAGSGPLEEALHAQAAELGLDGRITWTGWVDRERLRALNDECQITVFTSTGSEGMPMILVESLNSDSVVVTTSVRWTRSYPIGALGVIELAGPRPEDIAQGMHRAMNAPPIDPVLKDLRRKFLKTFSREVVAEEFVNLYRLICEEKRLG